MPSLRDLSMFTLTHVKAGPAELVNYLAYTLFEPGRILQRLAHSHASLDYIFDLNI